ncbi:MAG: cell division protein FtsH [Candidatus Komeilibacteria bacterium RIFCSPLOWO2_01_FULL_52_15]|uniref:ATP-dependent zinc metalloprotease FtsH n=2 Tax=Candidatus Komeiliibacteriota TaxID=1817908 RepID=A0A1G2BQQ1_9BACT|nr:MAG: cell division protein FtsH [Candidatus Komeilibacteria bacterium RIFCSPLOWO2_01_FULL_52_15]OGY90577.1 MAG: cell division protein FtsH [Candidatus Komeilibacteria bacterium RIFCSPHIGHO2_01_FULL_52_14]
MKQNVIKNVVTFILVFLLVSSFLSLFTIDKTRRQAIDVGTLVTEINDGKVESIEVAGDKLSVKLSDGTLQETQKEPTESLSTLLNNFSVSPDKLAEVKIDITNDTGLGFWMLTIAPIILPIIIIGFFIWMMMKQIQGANSKALMFGQSNAKQFQPQTKNRVTFSDVAGSHEAKIELSEIVEFLRKPQKFIELGAKIPKGVLLVGPPGTGKTLMARAVAGEAGVPFFHISGSEFVEMFVGVGASRVRDLFRKAKRQAPCIVFIDELDAVGRQRGAGLGGSHDEREQTLNQILVEMDGFDNQTNIIVVAATNRPDILDPALLRPGRFDRQVTLDLPDIREREEILKIHARNKPLAEGTDLKLVAQRTPGFSGADLANVLNEGAIMAGRDEQKIISQNCLFQAIEKVMLGPERRSSIMSEKEKKITAYHEAGHALVAHELPNADPVHKISIISRGRAGGYTLKLPTEDRKYHSRAEFLDDLAVMLAGHVAEKKIFNEVTTGASNDLKKATQLARQIVTQYGMSDELGPRTYGEHEELIFLGREIHERRDYSEKTAEAIDSTIMKLIRNALKTAEDIITRQRERLEKIAQTLLVKETLEKDEFEQLMATA